MGEWKYLYALLNSALDGHEWSS